MDDRIWEFENNDEPEFHTLTGTDDLIHCCVCGERAIAYWTIQESSAILIVPLCSESAQFVDTVLEAIDSL